MSHVRILVIEDELIVAEDICTMLEKLDYDVLGIAMNYTEGLAMLEEDLPDLVLADISLGGNKDGIDLGIEIRKKYNMPIVFLTSHADKTTVERAKQVKPDGYLVKPFDQSDLYTSIEMALVNFDGHPVAKSDANDSVGLLVNDSIFVKDGHKFCKVQMDELLWMRSEGNYLELHTAGKKRFVIRSSMRDFLDKLPQKRFFRVHKSHAVNLSKVEAINSLNIEIDGAEIPLGRNFRDELLNHLNTA